MNALEDCFITMHFQLIMLMASLCIKRELMFTFSRRYLLMIMEKILAMCVSSGQYCHFFNVNRYALLDNGIACVILSPQLETDARQPLTTITGQIREAYTSQANFPDKRSL